ncbi:MAG: aspartate/glutamate racemase family protein [Proteobacteria bacterium]|nr:aspartate/glutamate racemase family protein [Pseudomonadota bacterium]
MSQILVINPNSTEAVTRSMDDALEPLRAPGGPDIKSVTLAEGPPGIQSQRDVDFVVPHLVRRIAADNQSDAFVIACFSDPGLYAARETTARPVLGISEVGMTTALNLGQRIGVIAVLKQSIPRHTRYFRAMGIAERVAGEVAVDLPVVELSDEAKTKSRMLAVGRTLKDSHGADVLVMGCAGMARYRAPLEDALGIPVIDPTQAAVGLALALVRLGLKPRATT